jgi:hypothetical protein
MIDDVDCFLDFSKARYLSTEWGIGLIFPADFMRDRIGRSSVTERPLVCYLLFLSADDSAVLIDL